MLLGQVVHRAFDRSPQAGTLRRRRELGVLWILVGSGFWTLLDGLLYLTLSSQLQWEVAWADIALGLLLVGCALSGNRGGWMDAAVLALLILLGSDALANIWQVVHLKNFTAVHVWSAALEVTQCALAVVYRSAYRRLPSAHALINPSRESETEP